MLGTPPSARDLRIAAEQLRLRIPYVSGNEAAALERVGSFVDALIPVMDAMESGDFDLSQLMNMQQGT